MRNTLVLTVSLCIATGCLSGGGSGAPSGNVSGNAAPTIGGAPATEVMATDLYTFTPTSSDANGDALTFSVSGLPVWAQFDRNTGRISGTPTAGDTGNYPDIRITVSDGSNSVSLPVFSITVTEIVYGAVTLSWTAPTENTDGTPLTDLDGYRLYWRKTHRNDYTDSVTIDNESITTYVLENIPIGQYRIVGTSFNTAGVESQYSNAVIVDVNQ